MDGRSGAYAANSKVHFPNYKVHETAMSKAGGAFVGADGSRIPSRGEQHVRVQTESGCLCGITFNDAPVTDPILSVSQLNDSGHDVLYQKRGGYIEHIKSGQRVSMYRREGVYWVKLKVLEPAEGEGAQHFRRQGEP